MLRYVGNGFLAGVPARDLTDEEAKAFGEEVLTRSGLYETVSPPPTPPHQGDGEGRRIRKINQKEVKDA